MMINMGIKRVRLNYQPVAKRKSNEIAYEVGRDHVLAVNRGQKEREKEICMNSKTMQMLESLFVKKRNIVNL